ncbi:MAG TPA: xylulokinase [Anaerolineales bacterium]|nr:xylulokinase [Anaerolineales bacterium]
MPFLLGLDLGTSSLKVVLFDENGSVVGRGAAAYPLHTPRPGHAEQDPEDWWRAAGEAARQSLSGVEGPVQVAALGLSGQMHGTVLLDEHNRPLAPAVIWPDQRSASQVAEITRLVGAERLIELAGSPVATGFMAATARWFQQEQPEVWRRVRRLLLPKDSLRWRLTGEFAGDPSDGSGALLLDVRARDWSDEILGALGIERELLPAIQPSAALAGELCSDAAQHLGLPAGLPVVTGAADTAAGLLGGGATGPGELLLTLSTGGQLALPSFEVEVDRQGRVHTFCSALEPEPDRAGWYRLGATLSAGGSLRWLRDNVFALEGEGAYESMTAWAEQAPPGANGLVFLPYLAGERTPLMDPQARGIFLGLALGHGRAELVRAVLEGVALSCYEAYRVLVEGGGRPERLILAGGGSRSRLWGQIVADVFALPVVRLETAEQSAVGAALLAGAGAGHFSAGQEARAWARYGPPLEPDLTRHSLYLELGEVFRRAYLAHREDFPRLASLPV